MRKYTVFLLPILFTLSFLNTPAQTGNRSDARSLSMSNSAVASSTGIDAEGLNPANFDYHLKTIQDTSSSKLHPNFININKPVWEITILSVGGGYGSDESINFYNRYLSKLSINRETFAGLFTDINSVFDFRQNYLPSERTNVNYDFELKWFSVNYSNPKIGAFNFTISDKVGLNTEVLSRDEYLPLTFQFQIHGSFTDSLTNVQLHQSEATAWWLRKYSIGYAKEFEFNIGKSSFSFGLSAGLVHGFGNVITYNSSLYMNTYGIRSNSPNPTHIDSIKGKQNFYTEAALTDFFEDYNDGARSHYTFFPKPAGTGYSFDLGINLKIARVFRIAASITDIGKVTWNYNTKINYDTNSFIYRNFFIDKSDATYNQFVNDLEGLNTRDTTSSYTTNMPTKYRAGFLFQPSDKWMIEFDWMKGDNNLPGNTTKNIFSLGSEYFPTSFLPLRAGASIGGPESFVISIGTGLKLKHLVLDLAAYGLNNMVADKRFSFAFSAKLLL